MKRWVRAFSYLMVCLAGISVAALAPTSIEDRLAVWATIIWGILLACGIGACFGAASLRYRVEMFFIPFIAGALGIYAIVLWAQVPTEPSTIAAAFLITGYTSAVLPRYMELRDLAAQTPRRMKSGGDR